MVANAARTQESFLMSLLLSLLHDKKNDRRSATFLELLRNFFEWMFRQIAISLAWAASLILALARGREEPDAAYQLGNKGG
jgi:hypothetical protein